MAELVHLSVLSAHYEESPYKTWKRGRPEKEADRRTTGEIDRRMDVPAAAV